MKRLVLRALNPILFILMAVIAVSLQTSLFYSYPFLYLQPDVILLAVIWCALKRAFTEGGILTLVFANLAEIHSSVTHGIFLMTYMLVYFAVRGLFKIFALDHTERLWVWTLGISIFWKLSVLFLLSLLSLASHQWRHTLVLLFPGAAMEGVAAIWIYRWLEQFDVLTFKSKMSEEPSLDDLDFSEKGI